MPLGWRARRASADASIRSCRPASSRSPACLPREEAIARIKHSIEKSYGAKGAEVVRRNFEAVDDTLAHLHEVSVARHCDERLRPAATRVRRMRPSSCARSRAMMLAGRGDDIRGQRKCRIDGTFPSGHRGFEKRNISDIVAGLGAGSLHPVRPMQLRLPAQRHPRASTTTRTQLDGAPAGFKSAPVNARGYPDVRFTLQFYVEDCTGCGICVEVCPAHSPREPGVKAINLAAKAPILEAGARQHRLLRDAADQRPRAGRFRQCARRPVPAAAVRVLRRLRRLRRDAVPQAARRSCSATGCRSPTPPAARRSMAATCR